MTRWDRITAHVRRELEASGLSERAFARALGTTQQSLRRVLAGRSPGAAFLIAWGKSGRSIDALLLSGSRPRAVLPMREHGTRPDALRLLDLHSRLVTRRGIPA